MLKFVIMAIAAYILFKLVTGDKKKKAATQQQKNRDLAADGVMVKDPICGTFVPKDTDIRVKNGEDVHCFCSYECRDKYVEQLQAGQENKSVG
ncbi:transcriptional regulator [Desulfoplanes formicivorans]|uniref:Transcriptional regulator n=1 Tax=Desulfoplanes formicivorans TaxID=1592317 RepID=A0A194AJ59_9BACT|nr:transcriptional regulator [Desulfoplanes formicivorans]GAU09275.1 transcriptional regulator [Desulfoplanes formicivorans]